jgi:hypothetical protein
MFRFADVCRALNINALAVSKAVVKGQATPVLSKLQKDTPDIYR